MQTRYNLKNHAEHVYERMKNSIHRSERNDLNLNFVEMTEQNEILEIAYEHRKYSIPTTKESKATFITRMLFAQTIQFFSSGNETHTNDTTGYFSEYEGDIVFTSYFSVYLRRIQTIQFKFINSPPCYTSLLSKRKGKSFLDHPKR